jgi:acyl-CoA thioester hydrolase
MNPQADPQNLPAELTPWLAGFRLAITFPVQWGEMDAYRHVNNVVYFRYFENARAAYFHAVGWPEIEAATGVGPILTVAIRIVPPLAEDRFVMECRILSHKLLALAAEAKGVIVGYHYAEQRKAPLPEPLRQRIAHLEGWPDPGESPPDSSQ